MKITSLLLCLIISVNAKIFKKCELAKKLKYEYDIDVKEIPVWVCIAKHESNFNTSAVNTGSGDHGLFQISELYWCGAQHKAGACYANCKSYEDDDISDDLSCIRRIFNEHKRLSGDGFNAWVVYPLYCKGRNEQNVDECFQNENWSTTTEPSSPSIDTDDEYEFPPLPVSARREPVVIFPTWIFDWEYFI